MRSASVLGLLATGALVVAACVGCGSGSGDSAQAGATSQAPAAARSGTKFDPAKPAVTVGFHNMEGGAISVPDVRAGFEAGMDYVNSELGGINGGEMKAVSCKTDGSPESSVNCANQFVQKNVVLATSGVDFGADSMLPVLKSAGLAEMGMVALAPAMDQAVGDAWFAAFSAREAYAADVVEQHNLGAKSLAVAMVDTAATRSNYDNIIAPAAAKLGMTAKVFYYPTQADWTSLAATIAATNPDAVTLWTTGADALAAVPALRSVGFNGTINAGSNNEIIPRLDASVLQNVNFTSTFYSTDFASVPPKVKQDLDAFSYYIKKDGPNVQAMAQAQQGFYVAVQAADMLRQIKTDPLTAKAVHDGMGATKGGEIFRTTGYDCSKPTWPNSTACASGLLFAKVNGDKKLETLPDQPVDVTAVRPAS
ncbi:ABC transporter substrate-binding protein [Amycolatopsis sp. GM8]|uniref:ABC transporter substrate-binding protein n=1 Tax=Amycolatopsis sp. GM8 TaxID=2896530 RepID=UPI001F28BABB|nr:ABC transporter substrate-binding protein [Amycolatopsis sp. GM8]